MLIILVILKRLVFLVKGCQYSYNNIKNTHKDISFDSAYLCGPEEMITIVSDTLQENGFDEENIIFLTVDEHANVEADIYKYDEVNKRRNHLLKKYNLL